MLARQVARQVRHALDRMDGSGSVAMLFALSTAALFMATGAGIDLARTYTARQKLSEIATLACQFASRPSVIQTIAPSYSGQNGGQTYASAVQGYITSALTSQQFGYTQTNATPFTYQVNGPADVTLASTVPTTLMRVFRVNQLAVGATSHCYDNASTVAQRVPDGTSPNLLTESFETVGCGGACFFFYPQSGTPGSTVSTPRNTFSNSVSYTGDNNNKWYVMGYCLEVDTVGLIKSSVPDGTHSIELDCDNGSGTAGNSSISTSIYMPAGSYELRYFYNSRIAYPDYDPAYLCGSAASDLSWANSTNATGFPGALRTNQINVYLDLNASGQPPLHTTMDGTQTLAGQNLVDMCVYASQWVERSVRINVATAGFYWLSFAADGRNDSYGGQVDSVQLCPKTCADTLADNFPPAWLAANNGGAAKVLFRDRFESPIYPMVGCGGTCNMSGDMGASTGTSGTSASGWPSAAATGWNAAPYNQMDYMNGAAEGGQAIELDSTASGGQTTSNRSIGRRFLLDPGYYQVDYWYKASVTNAGFTATYCGPTPSAAGLTVVPYGYDTNFVGVFANHAQLASVPNGGFALNAAVTFTNPDGTVTTNPTVPPNAVSFSNYNAAQPNPLLDLCGYAPNWVARSAVMKIQKPAYYWLTVSALGLADNSGGRLDDVRLTALGSLAMASPPSGAVAIPVPDPQPGATVNFTGFSIVADPLIAPAPLP